MANDLSKFFYQPSFNASPRKPQSICQSFVIGSFVNVFPRQTFALYSIAVEGQEKSDAVKDQALFSGIKTAVAVRSTESMIVLPLDSL